MKMRVDFPGASEHSRTKERLCGVLCFVGFCGGFFFQCCQTFQDITKFVLLSEGDLKFNCI